MSLHSILTPDITLFQPSNFVRSMKLNESDRFKEVATFRFGIISEFVTGVCLKFGEKEKLLKEKTSRSYRIPFSDQTRICRSTIIKWTRDYKKAGFRIEGLYPQTRNDKGKYRSLDNNLQIAIKDIKREKPELTAVSLINELKHRKIIAATDEINLSSLYRYIKQENLNHITCSNKDRRSFEASLPNELWQSDVMHGPYVRAEGKNKKAYLIAFLDDHSRLILHAEFYLSEKLIDLKDCLKKAIEKRGLPQKIYIDNGSCFRAINLDQIAACLGIGIVHSKPYVPQGRGKIERWFRFVRDNFLPNYRSVSSLSSLNNLLEKWVEEYNEIRIHSSTKAIPIKRFQKNVKVVRSAPRDLMDYFRFIEFRKVKMDRTFKLFGGTFEAPVEMINKKIELRFHNDGLNEIEIYYEGISYGHAVLLDKKINFYLGRDKTVKPIIQKEIKIETGKLF